MQTMTTTRYKKSIKTLDDYTHAVLKQSSNKKIARHVTKGKFKGYAIRTLTLIERETCPTTCHHWNDCYGNNMPFAHRLDHSDPKLLMDKIHSDLLAHDWDRAGMLVRLHVLGDFFSVDYVRFWSMALDAFPGLACWGYTHREPHSDIGMAIDHLRRNYPDRFAIRWSDQPGRVFSANSASAVVPDGSITCPEQEDRAKGCGHCTLCWDQPKKRITFLDH